MGVSEHGELTRTQAIHCFDDQKQQRTHTATSFTSLLILSHYFSVRSKLIDDHNLFLQTSYLTLPFHKKMTSFADSNDYLLDGDDDMMMNIIEDENDEIFLGNKILDGDDADCDDIIMQLEADEGLLPKLLNDDVGRMKDELFTAGESDDLVAILSDDDDHSDTDSFFSSSQQDSDDRSLDSSNHSTPSTTPSTPEQQLMMAKLTESMQRTRQSRHSLLYYGKYIPVSRNGQVILSQVEYTSHHVMRMTSQPAY